MKAARLVVIALAGVSCWPEGDGPWDGLESDPCSPGNTRVGAACTVPAHSFGIEGVTTDWQDIEEVSIAPACESAPCEGLAPEVLQFSSRDDGWLAIHVRTLGGPPLRDDPSVRYVIELTATDEFPAPERDRLIASGTGVQFRKNDYVVDPPGRVTPFYLFAWTDDGFEASINTALLPFPAGARVAVYATRADQIVSSPEPLARACWLAELITEGVDTESDFKQDPCRSRSP